VNTYTLIYYPGFYPNPIWLRRVLLLVDDLTRIVPTGVPTQDSPELLALQEAIPECLRSISPEARDVEIENHDIHRLTKAFAFLARSRKPTSRDKVEMVFSNDGSMSISGHTFLHHEKVSPRIYDELSRHKLMIPGLEKSLDLGGFLAVEKKASNLILSSIAESISLRMGLDTITDEPIPFALNSLNTLGVTQLARKDSAEGVLLGSLASILIPLDVAILNPRDYRGLRDAYSSIRVAFKELTAELAGVNRLNHIQDPKSLRDRAKVTAVDFFKEYRDFRKTRYARSFKKWAPLYIGGALSMIAKVAAPNLALGIAGASLGIQVIQKRLERPADYPGRQRIFNMLAGIRKDILRRSGIKQII
jgi:hypothetical protein